MAVRIYNLHPAAQPPYAHTLAVTHSGRMHFPYHPGLSLKSMSEVKRLLPTGHACNCGEVASMFLDLFDAPHKYVHKAPSGYPYAHIGMSVDTPRRLGQDLFTLFTRDLALKALARKEARMLRKRIDLSQDVPRIRTINQAFLRTERSVDDRQDNLKRLIKYRDCSGALKVRWIRVLMRRSYARTNTQT